MVDLVLHDLFHLATMTSRNDLAIDVELDTDPLGVGNLSLEDDNSLVGETTPSSPDRQPTSTTCGGIGYV